MSEKRKHKIMLGIEVVLFCMIVAILGTNAASSTPPSNGVSYSKNNQTTVEGALNDLYTKANYGNASASQILKDKTALVGGSKVTGTMPNNLSGTASSVITYENSLYYRIPAGYYGGLGWGSEISATYADVASAIGLTAGKLLKGQTVLGITGTGETSCPECPTCPTCLNTSDATATAADISDGKTAYVNGQKITGTGMKGKTYEFSRKKATVSSEQTFTTGTWTRLVKKGGTTSFTIDLPFTASKLESCHVNLYGNYTSTSQNRWDADFAMNRADGNYWYMVNIPNDFYVSSSNSMNNYNDTIVDCSVKENKLVLRVYVSSNGTGDGTCAIQTRAGEFYLSGVIAYE
jgi:hypothetical protein